MPKLPADNWRLKDSANRMWYDGILNFLSHPLALAVIFAILFLFFVSFLTWFLKRRKRWMINSYNIRLPEAEKDTVARIRQIRMEIWQDWRTERTMDRKYWVKAIRTMINEVARNFHPKSKSPEKRIKLGQVLHHSHGLSERLAALMNHRWMGSFRDMSIRDIESWYGRINAVYSNKIVRKFTNKHMRRIYEFFFLMISTLNPFALGRRVAGTIGIEVATRYLFSAFFAILAEETWRMFDDKSKKTELERNAAIDQLIAVARSMKELSEKERRFLMSRIANAPLSDSKVFKRLQEVNKGYDKGKSLEKLLKDNDLDVAIKDISAFTKLKSRDEISKYSAMQALRKHGSGGK